MRMEYRDGPEMVPAFSLPSGAQGGDSEIPLEMVLWFLFPSQLRLPSSLSMNHVVFISAALQLVLSWAASPPNLLTLTRRIGVLVPEPATLSSVASARPRVWTSGANPGGGYGGKG